MWNCRRDCWCPAARFLSKSPMFCILSWIILLCWNYQVWGLCLLGRSCSLYLASPVVGGYASPQHWPLTKPWPLRLFEFKYNNVMSMKLETEYSRCHVHEAWDRIQQMLCPWSLRQNTADVMPMKLETEYSRCYVHEAWGRIQRTLCPWGLRQNTADIISMRQNTTERYVHEG